MSWISTLTIFAKSVQILDATNQVIQTIRAPDQSDIEMINSIAQTIFATIQFEDLIARAYSPLIEIQVGLAIASGLCDGARYVTSTIIKYQKSGRDWRWNDITVIAFDAAGRAAFRFSDVIGIYKNEKIEQIGQIFGLSVGLCEVALRLKSSLPAACRTLVGCCRHR